MWRSGYIALIPPLTATANAAICVPAREVGHPFISEAVMACRLLDSFALGERPSSIFSAEARAAPQYPRIWTAMPTKGPTNVFDRRYDRNQMWSVYKGH